ncbi:hypothetical protein BH11ACT5_BH11ACT5_16350 [soil metagenome]
MSVQATFFASTFVALICILFSIWQGGRLAKTIDKERPPKTTDATYAESPVIVHAYLEQSLEVAYSLPASALTLVAFGDLFEWSGLTGAVLVCVAVSLTLFFVWFIQPSKAGLFLSLRIGKLSVISLVVLLANIVGLILATTGWASPDGVFHHG